MTKRTLRGLGGLGSLLVALAALLLSASAATAVQSDQYAAFTACPTDDPRLNDPALETAICAAGSGNAQLRIGDRTIQLQRTGVQFAATGIGAEEPDCPIPGGCFGRVPDATTVEDDPSVVRVGAPGNGRSNPGKGNALQLKITVEAAGDVSAFSLAALFEPSVPLFRLPLKVHVEAPWLGDDCYIGSNQNPIVYEPRVGGAPEGTEFFADPNGFEVEVIVATGLPLADKTVAIPRAHDCGHGGSGSDARANALVNAHLDLPSPAGQNEVTYPAANLALAGAGFNGTPPDGGAALEAAFEAAR
jgi:hypothetical protein